MGYDIYIGNGEMEQLEYEDDEIPSSDDVYSRVIQGKMCYFRPRVNEVKLPDAPTFPNDYMTKNSNNRHPSYIGWSHFCEITGLEELFFHKEHGLMRKHPGFQSLHLEHASAIQSALTNWQRWHPNAVPGFEAERWMNNNESE